MVGKRLAIGLGTMVVGGVLVVLGLFKIPVASVVLILMGGAIGFTGYKIFETRRRDIPDDLNFG